MRDAFVVGLMSILPRKPASRLMGWAARLRLPAPLQRLLIRWYVRHYRVDVEECALPPTEYPTLEDFFVRELKPGARPLDDAPGSVVSPADALVAAAGTVRDGRIPQGGGLTVDVGALLGSGGEQFEGGSFALLYLSPPDYHRVHVPREGTITRWSYRPGRLFPVFPACAARVQDLFARNERMVTWFQTDAGVVALVMVGAFGVGRISTCYTDIISNAGHRAAEGAVAPPMLVKRGDELGRFHLGSTVVIFFQPGRVELAISPGDRVRVMGHIAKITGTGGPVGPRRNIAICRVNTTS